MLLLCGVPTLPSDFFNDISGWVLDNNKEKNHNWTLEKALVPLNSVSTIKKLKKGKKNVIKCSFEFRVNRTICTIQITIQRFGNDSCEIRFTYSIRIV